ncbi:DUF4373 domain-containing protein [uncultured Bacteroides sp.]|uniref:DUF4373 domain-containing protein n=1 Tax=uncultured Bacteroides sp. TaxID=162156 RepID=UPI002AA66B03|nr:DUF4373 domain-containing protein [uncultured Bacteroides sp.]
MARPLKNGLDYFPLDVDFLHDRKVRRIVRQNGCAGIAVVIALFCEIYRGKGYYVVWDEDLCFDVCDQTECVAEQVNSILKSCVQAGLFDPDLYASQHILTSCALQQRYIKINQDCKRKRSIDTAYCLFSVDEAPQKVVVSSEITEGEEGVSSEKTPQNKRKETKAQQSKVQHSKKEENRPQQTAFPPAGKAEEGAAPPAVKSPSISQTIDNKENIEVKPILKLNLDALNVKNAKTVEAINALSQRPELGGLNGVLWKVLSVQYRPLLVRKDNPGDYILWALNHPEMFEETYTHYLQKRRRG